MTEVQNQHKYKLTYFKDVRGRAEMVRMMLTMCGQPFEDIRYGFEEWPDLKPKTQLGFLPTLETEDGLLSQTTAMTNFIATRHGFQPESEWDRAVSESIIITANDLSSTVSSDVYMYTVYKVIPIPEGMDMEAEVKRVGEEIQNKYKFFEGLAKPGAKFMFGDKLTVADLAIYNYTEYFCVKFPETRTASDWIKTLLSNMETDERFAKYLKERPASWL